MIMDVNVLPVWKGLSLSKWKYKLEKKLSIFENAQLEKHWSLEKHYLLNKKRKGLLVWNSGRYTEIKI